MAHAFQLHIHCLPSLIMEDWACQTVLSCIIFQFKGELKYNLISNKMFLLLMIYIAL